MTVYFGSEIQKIANDDKKENKVTNTSYRDIFIECKCSINIIKEYIDNIIKNQRENMLLSRNGKIYNILNIYHVHIDVNNKDAKTYKWKHQITITNKTISNTFVSEHVEKTFLSDIDHFMNNEKYYKKKGYPYKRGYILYGEPGCGKTSLIKIVAQHYKIPVFLVDISMFDDNGSFVKIMQEINNFVELGKPHIVIYEDIDRCSLFNHFSKITEDCYLNIIDGIDECYGRISILTTNNIIKISKIKALLRPGRIDVQVNVTYCDTNQINRILDNYCDITIPSQSNNDNIEQILNSNIKITPAVLIHLTKYINNKNHTIYYLNKIIDFTNIAIENIIVDIQDTINILNGNLLLNDVISNDNNSLKISKPDETIKSYDAKERKYISNICEYKKIEYELENGIYDNKIKALEHKKQVDAYKVEKMKNESVIFKNINNLADTFTFVEKLQYPIIKTFFNGKRIDRKKFENFAKEYELNGHQKM